MSLLRPGVIKQHKPNPAQHTALIRSAVHLYCLSQEYEDKTKELQKLFKPLAERVKEAQDRPKAIEALNSMVNYSEHFLSSMKNFTGEVAGEQPFTTVEYGTLEKLITETRVWSLGKCWAAQNAFCRLKSHNDSCSDL